MSSPKRKIYKDWYDPKSKKLKPRSIFYYHKKKKAQLDILTEYDSTYSKSEHETDTDSEDQVQTQENHSNAYHANKNVSDKMPSHSSCNFHFDNINYPDAMITCPITHNSNFSERNYHNYDILSSNNLDDNDDWLDVFTTTAKCAVNYSENDSASEEEKEFHKNLTKENQERRKKSFLNQTILRKTNVSNGEIILMCILLGIRHSLTWVAMMDIITLINKLFDTDILNLSKFKLFGFFPDNKEWYKYQIFCPRCKIYIGERMSLPNTLSCPCCNVIIEDVQKVPYFLTLDVKCQLKQLLENPLVQPHLQYKHSRCKENIDNIEDILDGKLYKFLSSEGQILHDHLNFSYILNTDGCKAANSSTTSMWPVYLKIVELPPEIRDKHLILAGLWVNSEKPLMNMFLQPVVENLNKLSSEGVQWKKNGQNVTSKFIPLCCCVDSVCRCSMLNMKQYNGLFGCTFCYHPTQNISGLRKYPIDENVPALRTHDNIIKDMKSTQQLEKGKIVFKEVTGVKGPSILINLEYFNLAKGMTPDSMHSVYLGVAEHITSILFTSADKPYYIGSPTNIAIIDNRLGSFQIPKIITRSPRSVTTKNLWKASEWRSWLLFYCLICLQGILPAKYLRHLSKLIAGIEILSRSSVSLNDIDHAHDLLVEFCVYFQDLYGKENMTYNMHLLLHLAESVKNLGPLHMHDAFGFENENRLLLKLKTSPSQVSVQIAKRFLLYRSLPLFSSFFNIGSRIVEFIEHFENRLQECVHINDTVLIGAGKSYTFNENEKQLGFTGSALAYKKLVHNKRRYTTTSYAENLKVNDSIIKTKCGRLGVIQNICVVRINDIEKIVIFFNTIKLKGQSLFKVSHIKECEIQLKLQYCFPTDLNKQCIIMTVCEKNYVCDVPTTCIGD